jgi:hypothetical protein
MKNLTEISNQLIKTQVNLKLLMIICKQPMVVIILHILYNWLIFLVFQAICKMLDTQKIFITKSSYGMEAD